MNDHTIDHGAIIRSGVTRLNTWRKENPEVRLEARAVSLTDQDLRGADLEGADLRSADLSGANLTGADLRSADLRGATLRKTVLRNADLEHADLSKADLCKADLTDANLLSARGLPTAKNSDSIRVDMPGVVKGLEGLSLPWVDGWLAWERLRTLGKLQLFIPSYIALASLAIFFYFVALYNTAVIRIKSWSDVAASHSDHPFEGITAFIDQAVATYSPPQRYVVLIAATLLLALGSTLFSIFCPP